jgi:hypothetical protein
METLDTRECGIDEETGPVCNVTTPGGTSISIRSQDTNWYTSFRLVANETNIGALDAIEFAIYRISSNSQFDIMKSMDEHLSAARVTDCSLSIAAFRFAGAASNGSTFKFLNEERVKLDPFSRREDGTFGPIDGNRSATGALYGNQTAMLYNLEDGTTLSVGLAAMEILRTFFASKTISSEYVFGGGRRNADYGVSLALMGDVDLGDRFNSMAASMTNHLRSVQDHDILFGNNVQTNLFVNVRWYWLSGPAVLELASLLLAIMTIIWDVKTSALPPWKSSALALLVCVYDKQAGLVQNQVEDIRDARDLAKHSTIHLRS